MMISLDTYWERSQRSTLFFLEVSVKSFSHLWPVVSKHIMPIFSDNDDGLDMKKSFSRLTYQAQKHPPTLMSTHPLPPLPFFKHSIPGYHTTPANGDRRKPCMHMHSTQSKSSHHLPSLLPSLIYQEYIGSCIYPLLQIFQLEHLFIAK